MASKMRIAPFKPQVLMDRTTAQKSWEQLESSFNEIYNENNSSLQYEQVYRLSYNMVLQKHGDLLYQGVNDTFKAHATKTYHEIAAVPDQTLLHTILKAWEAHRRSICMIRDIVMYMDKTHVVHKKLAPVRFSVFAYISNYNVLRCLTWVLSYFVQLSFIILI